MQRPKILTQRLEIRVSPQDKAQIAAHAKEAGMEVTAWVRTRLLLDRNPKEKR